MSDTQVKYRLLAAYAQCGDTPPYNILPIPVRMNGDVPEIKIAGKWVPFPKDATRPNIDKYYGMPVAGIASDWETM